jgi:hypothetical protein
MRLSEVLSKNCITEFVEIDGFINRKISVGKQQKIDVGKVALNFYCNKCNDTRTFLSGADLYCIGVNQRQISIDCVLKCAGDCGTSVAVWFLIECQDGEDTDNNRQYVNNYIYGIAPKVRILKRREKLSEQVRLVGGEYAEYAELLDKAVRAYRDGLGAGAMVYLRKIFEQITSQTARACSIPGASGNGKRKPFKTLLEEVDRQRHIVPAEFSADGYRLFGELSDVVHGDHDEDLALRKFDSLHRLVVGILDNVKNNQELNAAIGSLGWNTQTEAQSHE